MNFMAPTFRATKLALVSLLLVTPATAAEWVVNKDESQLTFEASVFGSSVPGLFGAWDAEISFDESDLSSSSVSVTIDMTSATTNDGARDESLKGPDWFATSEFPQAQLTSTGFRSTGDDTFEMDAELTMRGTTNAITLPFTLTPGSDGTQATGTVIVNRTDYGIGQGDFVSGGTVAHDVSISIDIAASTGQ